MRTKLAGRMGFARRAEVSAELPFDASIDSLVFRVAV